MCPEKTENLSRNVPRAEGEFWRGLVRDMRVKSRAQLENFLLLEGLKAMNRKAARKLAAIRAEALGALPGKPMVAGLILLVTFFGGSAGQLLLAHHHHDLRAAKLARHSGRPGRDWLADGAGVEV